MRISKNNSWAEANLDFFARPNDIVIYPLVWLECAPVHGLYFEQPFDLRRVFEYVKDVGAPAVARKIRSRLSERARDRKFISCGIGSLHQSKPEHLAFNIDDLRIFVAPAHPSGVDRLVLPKVLVLPISRIPEIIAPGNFHFANWPESISSRRIFDLAGWNPDSGSEIPTPLTEVDAQTILRAIEETREWQTTEVTPRRVTTRTVHPPHTSGAQPTASLFGLGQYAKVAIIPNIKDSIKLKTVHEIDPLQAGSAGGLGVQIDTCPTLREDEHPDVVFIAAYHHHHSPLAVQALQRNAAVVIEKPLATTRQQSKELLDAKQEYGGRVFPGFHKRYAKTNDWLEHDMGAFGENVKDMHCVVYEVALPDRHWYRWPRSGSRLLSNGCHWLDHFLFVNNFPGLADSHVAVLNPATTSVNATLQNGACFTMTLTDRGPDRVGLREYVEIRTGSRLATITNGHSYHAESSKKILRSAAVPRSQSYARMYSKISREIIKGTPGDDQRMLEQSMNFVLTLEEALGRINAPALPADAKP